MATQRRASRCSATSTCSRGRRCTARRAAAARAPLVSLRLGRAAGAARVDARRGAGERFTACDAAMAGRPPAARRGRPRILENPNNCTFEEERSVSHEKAGG
ncbi:hypothetical protein OsJ_36665 [Oryza sativa Japonica Group]|uniref:Uncharacterized protein n=1 Tax=Oryza sativa subsp. japonica TaxID=39947 RepID=B9GDZ3_ORYSJ|nr:hypothetical protein OsJ_36665 [Oryza sativa Japonica Group]